MGFILLISFVGFKGLRNSYICIVTIKRKVMEGVPEPTHTGWDWELEYAHECTSFLNLKHRDTY